jgi:hypothetical protein
MRWESSLGLSFQPNAPKDVAIFEVLDQAAQR